jgi:hypothetical protein
MQKNQKITSEGAEMTDYYEPQTEAEKAAFNLFGALLASGMDPIDAAHDTVSTFGKESMARFLKMVFDELLQMDHSRFL